MKYYPFYAEEESQIAAVDAVKELGEDFGFYEMSSKFYGGNTVKDLPSRDWKDEDGSDVFVPNVLRYKSYDMEVKFGYKGDFKSANDKLKALKTFLGKGYLRIYDSYNMIGRQHVRLLEISNDATLVRNDTDGDILVITIKFRVDDPVTDITLTKKSQAVIGQ